MSLSGDPKWRKFEKLVSKVQEELAPDATIKHDDHIYGYDSEKERQIDISVRQQIGQFNLLIAIECKDHKVPVDIEEVETFVNKVRDIRANKGAMVASNGFTDGAIKIGQRNGIDLYRLIDAEAHDWPTYVSIPVLCEFLSLDQFRFRVPNLLANRKPHTIMLYDVSEQQIGTMDAIIPKRWNAGQLPSQPGEHGWFRLIETPMLIQHDGKFIEVDIQAKIRVKNKLYFGYLPLIDIKGYRDEISGAIATRGFTTDWLNVKKVEQEWRELSRADEIAVTPLLTLTAIDVYELP